jgi:hypothetical protein
MNKKRMGNDSGWHYLGGMLCVFSLGACQSQWYPEVGFGSSVNNAITEQIANKNAPEVTQRESQGMDGPAAKASIDNYQRSFEQTGALGISGGGSNPIISPTGSATTSNLPSITGR